MINNAQRSNSILIDFIRQNAFEWLNSLGINLALQLQADTTRPVGHLLQNLISGFLLHTSKGPSTSCFQILPVILDQWVLSMRSSISLCVSKHFNWKSQLLKETSSHRRCLSNWASRTISIKGCLSSYGRQNSTKISTVHINLPEKKLWFCFKCF